MSILRLGSTAYGPIDCRYIQSVDLEISNYGTESFEMLIHGYGDQGLFYIGLIHAESGETLPINDIMTHYAPFELVLVSNTNSVDRTYVTIRVKNHGSLIAVYTQEDTIRTL